MRHAGSLTGVAVPGLDQRRRAYDVERGVVWACLARAERVGGGCFLGRSLGREKRMEGGRTRQGRAATLKLEKPMAGAAGAGCNKGRTRVQDPFRVV